MRLRTLAIKLCVSLTAMLFALLILEVALRIYNAATKPTEQTEILPVPVLVPTAAPFIYELNSAHPDISSQRTRDDEVPLPKPAGTFRLLVLGDSLAYGSFISKEDTFPAFLETRLREELGAADVVNAGVPGYSPYNELQYYLTQGRSFGADVVLVAFCMNDVVNPRLHWGTFVNMEDSGIPVEAIPNRQYDQTYALPKAQRLREARLRGAGEEGPPLLKHSALYRAMASRLAPLFGESSDQKGTGVPTRLTGEDNISIEVLLDRSSPEWLWLASMYERLHAAVSMDGAQMVIVIFPLAYQMDAGYPFFPQEQLLAYCEQESITCLDLLPAFRRHRKEDLFLLGKAGFDDVWHLARYGHKVTADEILGLLREKGLLDRDAKAGRDRK